MSVVGVFKKWKFGLCVIMILSQISRAFATKAAKARIDPLDVLQNKTEKFIPANYLKNSMPPTSNGEPIEVTYSMRIFLISSINEEQMDFGIDMYIKMEWQDTRISIPEEIHESGRDAIYLSSDLFQHMWKPDLYFLNSKIEEKPTLAHKYASVTLFKNKTICYVARIHAVVACLMEFSRFPMDTQICPIIIESFAHNNNLMNLNWKEREGVTISPNIKHLQYNIRPLHLVDTHMYTTEKNGNFSRLMAYFVFERQIGHHIIHIYAPSTLIVALSWFSFWLDFDAIPGRVTLLVTCQLALVTMFSDLRDTTPPVDYVKAMDIWMAACMISVFGAVAEFVIAKVLFGKYNDLKKKEMEQKIKDARSSTISEFIDPNSPQYNNNNFRYKTAKKRRFVAVYWVNNKGKEKIMWKQVDFISRLAFPIIFLIFNIIYWTMMIYDREECRRVQAKSLE